MKFTPTLCRTGALTLLLCATLPAYADIYTYTDEHGVLNFTNVSRDPRARLIFVEPKPVVPPPAPADAASDPAVPGTLQALIAAAAARNGVEAALVQAVIQVESGFNPRAVSPKGARGLMQLMPATAQRLGVADAFDPRQNVEGGTRYLADLLALFKNDFRLALAAYNAGENAVIQYGNRVPPFRETLDYVPRVLDYYRRYRAGYLRLSSAP
jgi:soluble lytic murein transglycosylase-like protein